MLHPSFAQRSAVAADAQKFIDNLGDASIGSLTGASLSEAGREARFRSLLEITIRHAQDKQVRAGPLLAGDERRRARRLPALFNDQLVQADLSPKPHPLMSRVRSSFEPVWLGGATGRGAKPGSERSVPSRCMAEALSLA